MGAIDFQKIASRLSGIWIAARRRPVAALALIALFWRLPFFFNAQNDHDEASFLMMGAMIADGHLPYTIAWDQKPPLGYYGFALIDTMSFGKIWVVRLIGAALVWLVGVLTYLTARRVAPHGPALAAGALTIVFISSLRSAGQSVMTETIAMPFVMAAAYLLSIADGRSARPRLPALAAAGFLVACAALTRINLAALAVAGGLWLLLQPGVGGVAERTFRAAVFSLGGLSVMGLVYAFFAANSAADLFFTSLFDAPLAYGREGASYLITALTAPGAAFSSDGGLLMLSFVVAFVIVFLKRSEFSSAQRARIVLLGVFALAIYASIVITKRSYPHYFMQLAPFLAIAAALAFDRLSGRQLRAFRISVAVGVALAVTAPLIEYGKRAVEIATGDRLDDDRAYWAERTLKSRLDPGQTVFMLSDHIALWRLGLAPVDPIVTHPSNIAYDHLVRVVHGPAASAETALKAVMDRKPNYIVRPSLVEYFEERPALKAIFEAALANDYAQIADHDDLIILELRRESDDTRRQ
ncbi:MAG: glycosyltransferase family 39 protein [Pseudomonadota bacterium]